MSFLINKIKDLYWYIRDSIDFHRGLKLPIPDAEIEDYTQRARIAMMIRYNFCTNWETEEEAAYMKLLDDWWRNRDTITLFPIQQKIIELFLVRRLQKLDEKSLTYQYISVIINEIHKEMTKGENSDG